MRKMNKLMSMACMMLAASPHLPPAAYASYFSRTAPGRRNTAEIDAWNKAVDQRKAEKRARRGK